MFLLLLWPMLLQDVRYHGSSLSSPIYPVKVKFSSLWFLILIISVHFCFYFPTNRNSHTPSMIFFSVFFCSPRSLFPQVSSSSLRKLSSIYSHVGEIIEHFYWTLSSMYLFKYPMFKKICLCVWCRKVWEF